MRMNRKLAIKKKMYECPEDNPASNMTIDDESGENELGDWKLKSSKSFQVPPEKQVNIKGKGADMIKCQEAIFNTKKTFNSKLLSLKREKEILIQDLESKNSRVQKIESILESNENKSLLRHISDQKAAIEITTEGTIEKYSLESLFPQTIETSPSSILGEYHLSKLEMDEIEGRKTVILFEREKLSRDIHDMVSNFDESVYNLSRERFRILLETKILEFNLFNMFHEIQLLQQFEDTDKSLKEKMDELNREKDEVRSNQWDKNMNASLLCFSFLLSQFHLDYQINPYE